MASGELRNFWRNGNQMCLDSAAKKNDLHKPVGVYPCHNQVLIYRNMNITQLEFVQGGNQYWMLSKEGEIRRDEACLDYAGAGSKVILFNCHGSKGNQEWVYNHDAKILKHASSGKCLELKESKDGLEMKQCDHKEERQQWRFKTFNGTHT